MKKFEFTLGRILAFKRTVYEKERSVLAQLRAQRLQIEKKREDTIQQTLQLDASFREKAATVGVKVQEANSLSFHRENAVRLVKQFVQEIAEIDIEIEKQLEIVIQLDKDVKGLEKLQEKQLEEYNAAAMKEEQERISEMVSSKFIEEQQQVEP